jgi:hypothetical protein
LEYFDFEEQKNVFIFGETGTKNYNTISLKSNYRDSFKGKLTLPSKDNNN